MKFFTTLAVLAAFTTSAIDASCFCSPRNGCKCACGPQSIVSDSQWSWSGTGQDGYLGNFANCGPGNYHHKVVSNQNLGGGAFGWKCLFIACGRSADE